MLLIASRVTKSKESKEKASYGISAQPYQRGQRSQASIIVNKVAIPKKGVIYQTHGWFVTHILRRKQTLRLQCGQAGENTPAAILPVTYITNKQQTVFYLEPILMTPSPAGYELEHNYSMSCSLHSTVCSSQEPLIFSGLLPSPNPASSSHHSQIQEKKKLGVY